MPNETKESTTSNGEISNVDPLPPPNMDYLTRKPCVPLKWTPTNKCSGFVMEDNTVVFIGTRKYEDAIQQSFLDSLRGGEGNLDDYLAPMCVGELGALKEDHKPTDETMPAALSESTRKTSIRSLSDSENTVLSKLSSSVDHKVREARKLDSLTDCSYVRRPSSNDASSSSDDEELPRVQVTGRSAPAGEQPRTIGTWRIGSGEVAKPETDNTGAWQTMCSSSSGAVRCDEGSEYTPHRCPICNVSLPLRYTEY